MTDQKNLILAIAASIAILFSFEVIWPLVTGQPIVAPPPAEQSESESAAPAVPTAESGAIEVPAPGGVQSQQPAATVTAGQTRADLLASTPRVEIETPTLKGSISLIGARLDDLTLRRYSESVEPGSPPIDLLEPPGQLSVTGCSGVSLSWDACQSVSACGSAGLPLLAIQPKSAK